MALVDVRGFNVQPDVAGSIASGFQTGQQLRSQFKQNQEAENVVDRGNQFRNLTQQVLDPSLSNAERLTAQNQLTSLNPQQAQQVLKTEKSRIEGITDRDSAILRDTTNAALKFQGLPDVASKIKSLTSRVQELDADPTRTSDETREILELYQQGRIEEADSLIAKSVQIGERLGFIEPLGGASGGLASAKTKILSSGATIAFLPNAESEVRNASGKLVFGQERLDVIAEDRAEEQARKQADSDRTVDTTRRVEQVKDASETANKAFGMVDSIRQNIDNLKQVVPLVGQGANTGPIASLFPSLKAETIRLEQLQKRLALDVVGAVTFGALSKGELDLAKAVALPLNLEDDELIQWVNDSIAAKEKLAQYFEDQAIFLSQGNTQADFLKKQRAELKSLGSESDIRQTMKDNNLTRSEVIQELKRRKAGGR